jgi:hypothetical protein
VPHLQAGSAVVSVQSVSLALLLAGLAIAADLVRAEEPKLVSKVIDAMPADAEARCAYTRVSLEDGSSDVERYDPSDGRPFWTLLSVNDQPPGEAALRRYAGREENRSDRNHPMDLDIREMVDSASWRLASDDGQLVEFEFRLQPHGDLTERMVERVRGSFVIDKAARQPIRLRIENTESANVAPFVRISRYVEDIRFHYDEGIGAAVPVERRTERGGRALGLKSLDRIKIFRYEDYVCT